MSSRKTNTKKRKYENHLYQELSYYLNLNDSQTEVHLMNKDITPYVKEIMRKGITNAFNFCLIIKKMGLNRNDQCFILKKLNKMSQNNGFKSSFRQIMHSNSSHKNIWLTYYASSIPQEMYDIIKSCFLSKYNTVNKKEDLLQEIKLEIELISGRAIKNESGSFVISLPTTRSSENLEYNLSSNDSDVEIETQEMDVTYSADDNYDDAYFQSPIDYNDEYDIRYYY